MADFKTLTLTHSDHIARLTLTRGARMNVIDADAHGEIFTALKTLKEMREARAVIIAAEGKFFSAGGDFDYMLKLNRAPDLNAKTADEAAAMVAAMLDIDIPMIAAVKGDAIGFGATLALACDIVVAARGANFSDPHVMAGLAAGDGGCLVWPQAAGMSRAKRYLLTGEALSAQKAYEFGLVTDLVDTAEEAAPAAQKIAAKIAALAPLAVQGTKRSLNLLQKARAGEVVFDAAKAEQETMASNDLVEAVAAIKERRKGVFKGE